MKCNVKPRLLQHECDILFNAIKMRRKRMTLMWKERGTVNAAPCLPHNHYSGRLSHYTVNTQMKKELLQWFKMTFILHSHRTDNSVHFIRVRWEVTIGENDNCRKQKFFSPSFNNASRGTKEQETEENFFTWITKWKRRMKNLKVMQKALNIFYDAGDRTGWWENLDCSVWLWKFLSRPFALQFILLPTAISSRPRLSQLN